MTDIYAEMCAILNANTVDMLGWMSVRGQSVSLNWGEDNRQWECSWISSGKRFTGVRGDIPSAIRDAIGAARADYLIEFGEEAWEPGQ